MAVENFQPRILIKDGLPPESEGYEGEIRFGKHEGKLYQFVRYNSTWHSHPFAQNAGAALDESISNVIVQAKTLTSQTITSLVVDNIKIKENLYDNSGGSGVSSTILVNHPSDHNQAHDDYMVSGGEQTFEGSINFQGGSTLAAVANYMIKGYSPTASAEDRNVFFIGNPGYGAAWVKKTGFYLAPASIEGIFHIATDSGTDFKLEDDGNLNIQTATVTAGVIANELNINAGTATIPSDGKITALSINTNDKGDNEVHPLRTPSAASNGTIERESGDAQGSAALKFKVTDDSIGDDQLEFDTGQLLSTAGTPQFARLGLGAAADGTVPLKLSTANANKIQLDDISSGTSTAYIGSSDDGDITLTPTATKKVIIGETGTSVGQGLSSTVYTSGWAGAGWAISQDSGGNYTLDIDNIVVRDSMSVYELIIQQIRATNGSLIIGSADRVITITETTAPEYKFTIESDYKVSVSDGARVLHFETGDLILAQKWQGGVGSQGSPSNYIRLRAEVTETSNDSGSALDPNEFLVNIEAGDESQIDGVPLEFVRVGNIGTDAGGDDDRRGGIYLTADDTNAPFIDIFDEVDSFAAWDAPAKTKARLGKLDGLTYDSGGGSGAQSIDGYGLYSQKAYLEGEIKATSGYIGNASQGWIIDAAGLLNASAAATTRIQIGSGGQFTSGMKFYVDGTGYLSVQDKFKIESNGNLTIIGNIYGADNNPLDDAIVFTGAWEDIAYFVNQVVVWTDTNQYRCIVATTAESGNNPDNATYWEPWAIDGTSADTHKRFTVYQNAEASATPSNTDVVVDSTGAMSPTPEGWSLTATTPTTPAVTYFSQSSWVQTEGAGAYAIDGSWSAGSQFSGTDGTDGPTGGPGDTGGPGPTGGPGTIGPTGGPGTIGPTGGPGPSGGDGDTGGPGPSGEPGSDGEGVVWKYDTYNAAPVYAGYWNMKDGGGELSDAFNISTDGDIMINLTDASDGWHNAFLLGMSIGDRIQLGVIEGDNKGNFGLYELTDVPSIAANFCTIPVKTIEHLGNRGDDDEAINIYVNVGGQGPTGPGGPTGGPGESIIGPTGGPGGPGDTGPSGASIIGPTGGPGPSGASTIGPTGPVGTGAITVSLTSSSYIVAYDDNDNLDTPATITLTATHQGLEGTVYYQYYKNGSALTNDDNDTGFDEVVFTPSAEPFGVDTYKVEIMQGSLSGTVLASDSLSINSIEETAEGLPGSSLKITPQFNNGVTVFPIFYDAGDTGLLSASGQFYFYGENAVPGGGNPADGINLTYTADTNYSEYYINGNCPWAEIAYMGINTNYGNLPDYFEGYMEDTFTSGETVVLKYNDDNWGAYTASYWAPSDGPDGNGDMILKMTLLASRGDGPQHSTQGVFEYIGFSTGVKGETGPDGPSGQDGGDSYTVAISNEAHSIPTTGLGNQTWKGAWFTATSYLQFDSVTNDSIVYICKVGHLSSSSNEPPNSSFWDVAIDEFAGSGTMIAAYLGITPLTPTLGTPGAGEFGVTSYSVTSPAVAGTPITINGNQLQVPELVGWTTPNDSSASGVYVVGLEGTANTITKVTSYALAVGGTDGDTGPHGPTGGPGGPGATGPSGLSITGPPGPSGGDGTSPPMVTLSSSSHVIVFDGDGNNPNPSASAGITFTATESNHDGTVYYRWKVNGFVQQNNTSNEFVWDENHNAGEDGGEGVPFPYPSTIPSTPWELKVETLSSLQSGTSGTVFAIDTLSLAFLSDGSIGPSGDSGGPGPTGGPGPSGDSIIGPIGPSGGAAYGYSIPYHLTGNPNPGNGVGSWAANTANSFVSANAFYNEGYNIYTDFSDTNMLILNMLDREAINHYTYFSSLSEGDSAQIYLAEDRYYNFEIEDMQIHWVGVWAFKVAFVSEVISGGETEVDTSPTNQDMSIRFGKAPTGPKGETGDVGITVVLSADAVNLYVDAAGTVSYDGSGTLIQAYEGSTQLDGILGGGTPADGEFSIDGIYQNDIEAGTPFLVGNSIEYPDASNFDTGGGQTTASLVFVIKAKSAENESVTTITKTQNFTLLTVGPDGPTGGTGGPGPSGPDGPSGVEGPTGYSTMNMANQDYSQFEWWALPLGTSSGDDLAAIVDTKQWQGTRCIQYQGRTGAQDGGLNLNQLQDTLTGTGQTAEHYNVNPFHGDDILVSFYYIGPSGDDDNLKITVRMYTSAGYVQSEELDVNTGGTNSSWQRLSFAITGTDAFRRYFPQIRIDDNQRGENHYIDAFMIEKLDDTDGTPSTYIPPVPQGGNWGHITDFFDPPDVGPGYSAFHEDNESDPKRMGYVHDGQWITYMDSHGDFFLKSQEAGNPNYLSWDSSAGLLQITAQINVGSETINQFYARASNAGMPDNNEADMLDYRALMWNNKVVGSPPAVSPNTVYDKIYNDEDGVYLMVIDKDLRIRWSDVYDLNPNSYATQVLFDAKCTTLLQYINGQLNVPYNGPYQQNQPIKGEDLIILLTQGSNAFNESLYNKIIDLGGANPYSEILTTTEGVEFCGVPAIDGDDADNDWANSLKTSQLYVLQRQFSGELGSGNVGTGMSRIAPYHDYNNYEDGAVGAGPYYYAEATWSYNGGVLNGGSTGVGTTISGNTISCGIIKSNNYATGGNDTYTTSGTIFNLQTGALQSKSFLIKEDGSAAFKGDISAATGTFAGGINAGVVELGPALTAGPAVGGVAADGIGFTLNSFVDNHWLHNLAGTAGSDATFFSVGSPTNYIKWESLTPSLKILLADGSFTLGSTDISNPDNMTSYINLGDGAVQIGGEFLEITGRTTFGSSGLARTIWRWDGRKSGSDACYDLTAVANLGKYVNWSGTNVDESLYGYGEHSADDNSLTYLGASEYSTGPTPQSDIHDYGEDASDVINSPNMPSSLAYITRLGNNSGTNDYSKIIFRGGADGVDDNNIYSAGTIQKGSYHVYAYDVNKRYEMSIRMKTASTDSLAKIWCGFECYDADGIILNRTGVNSSSNQHYFVLESLTLTQSGGGWNTYTGYIEGWGPDGTNAETAGADFGSSTPFEPCVAYYGTKYFTPLIISGWSSVACPARTYIDWIKVVEGEPGSTVIDGASISTGVISADRIDVTDIFSRDITATGSISGARIVSPHATLADCVMEAGKIEGGEIVGATISGTTSISSPTIDGGNIIGTNFWLNGQDPDADDPPETPFLDSLTGTLSTPYLAIPKIKRAGSYSDIKVQRATGSTTYYRSMYFAEFGYSTSSNASHTPNYQLTDVCYGATIAWNVYYFYRDNDVRFPRVRWWYEGGGTTDAQGYTPSINNYNNEPGLTLGFYAVVNPTDGIINFDSYTTTGSVGGTVYDGFRVVTHLVQVNNLP